MNCVLCLGVRIRLQIDIHDKLGAVTIYKAALVKEVKGSLGCVEHDDWHAEDMEISDVAWT